MGKNSQIARLPDAKKRRYTRFSLRQPVQLKVSSGNKVFELQATSRNVSIGGLLLEVSSPVPKHSAVSFTLSLQGSAVVRPVELVGEGHIVRVELPTPGSGFAIAAECNRPSL